MKINIDVVKPGMVAKHAIYEKNQSYPLINENSIITEFDLAKLKNRGFKSIHVKTNGEIEENSSFVLYDYLRDAYEKLDYVKVVELSKELVSKMLNNPYPVLNLNHYFEVNEDDFMHKFNICLMSTFIGIIYNKEQFYKEKIVKLDYLAAASIMQDIGKKYQNAEIFKNIFSPKLNRVMFPGYDEKMFSNYDEKLYPLYSYAMMNNEAEIPAALKNIFLYLNEREDGRGIFKIPKEVMSNSNRKDIICSKIINIARQYDYLLTKVIKNDIDVANIPIIMNQAVVSNGLSEELVNMFLNYIPIYAKGTRVLLSNYQTGFIKNINLQFIDKPVVIIENTNELVDLSQREDIFIKKIIELEFIEVKSNSISK